MKNILQLFSFFIILSLLAVSCGDDEPDNSCVTDPAVTIGENIIGTWTIGGEADETVTFNADGTGSSSDASFYFSTTNEGNEYHNFDWAIEEDSTIVVTYDYSPDIPVIPFLISVDYEVLVNNCDRVELDAFTGVLPVLTR